MYNNNKLIAKYYREIMKTIFYKNNNPNEINASRFYNLPKTIKTQFGLRYHQHWHSHRFYTPKTALFKPNHTQN